MKIAVIGAGYWGKNHVRDLKKLGHEITVCDLDQKNLEACKKNFSADFTTTKLQDVLLDKSIKAATVCVPNQLHFQTAKKLLEKGKHVLVEKPMCLSSSDCKKLISLARKKKLKLCVGHIFRFNNSVKKLKELIDKKDLGEIQIVKLSWTNLDPVYPDRDIFSDLGVHAFDIVNFLFGKNPSIFSASSGVFRKKKGSEAAFVIGKINNTVLAFEFSWLTPEKKRAIMVVGSKKTAFVDTLSQSIHLSDHNSMKTMLITHETQNPLIEELNHFVDCIDTGKKPITDGKIGLEIVSLIEKVQKMQK